MEKQYEEKEILKSQNKTIPVTEGTHLTMNNQEYVFRNGKLSPVQNEVQEKPTFIIWFDKQQIEWGRQTKISDSKVNGLDVIVKGKLVGIDIYPILKEIFGASNYVTLDSYKGVQYQVVSEDTNQVVTVPFTSLSFNSREMDRIKEEIDRMFDMSVVNKNQLQSYKSHVDSIFSDFFKDFLSMF